MPAAQALTALLATSIALTDISGPHELVSAPLERSAVVVRGTGPTVVLMSGLLGGTARLAPMANRLVAEGFRVVAIDAYRLALGTADVSFDGMARTVAAVLERESVDAAVVVAHAHGAGIALRLAAVAPARVAELIFLDAGVVTRTHSPGVERALRVASLVSRLPGGANLVRSRLVSGIRANSADPRWLTDDIARAYADPLLAELPVVSVLASRLAAAREPQAITTVLARVRAPLTILLGAVPHATGAGDEELALARQLPEVRMQSVAGAGHFVHEEAPTAVVDAVRAARRSVVTASR